MSPVGAHSKPFSHPTAPPPNSLLRLSLGLGPCKNDIYQY